MQKINVFAGFDGLRGGRIALDRLSIPVNEYYSSEIDKWAVKIGRKNYPKCVELGDICKVVIEDLDPIDLIIGGSPCQNFSMSGEKAGMVTADNIEVTTLDKYLELKADPEFEFTGSSWLFWEFALKLREIKKINPDVKFMLENVIMNDKWAKVITEELCVDPVILCASEVLPQLRPRMYWCNWPVKQLEKSSAGFSRIKDIMIGENEEFSHVYMKDDRFADLVPSGNKGMGKTRPILHKASRRQGYQVFDKYYKVECLDTCQGGGRIPSVLIREGKARHLHPIEFELLQGLDYNYTEGASKGQRYKMIGNGWPLPVIEHILQCLINTGWMK